MMNTWLMRRSVRSPVSRATTSCISSSVCRLPFISRLACPPRTSWTAAAAAAWLCGASTMAAPPRSRPQRSATSRIFCCGPTRMGVSRPSCMACSAAPSEVSSQGWATAQGSAGRVRACAIRRS
ncbi:Uncharacterised protein [Bordetella pertussis]|nr:Uncharacterised protein [Bordetella pertussis]